MASVDQTPTRARQPFDASVDQAEARSADCRTVGEMQMGANEARAAPEKRSSALQGITGGKLRYGAMELGKSVPGRTVKDHTASSDS
jgi:hypothetical protein